MPEVVRVLLVEDHAFTRDGLRATLNLEPDLRVVAEARSGEEALTSVRLDEVDVAVVDIGLPGMDGIQAAAELKRLRPALRIVMLTAHNLREEVLAALAAGADAYCVKSARMDLLLLAVRAAATGSAYLDPQVAHHVLSGVKAPDPAVPLTPRELEVLRRMADGWPNRDIADALDVSVSMVKLHVQEILVKLQASDRTQAAVKALRAGWLP